MLLEILLLILTIFLIFYKWATANYGYFKKLKIPFIKPFPLLGSYTGFLFKTESMLEEFLRRHNEFKKFKVYGVYDFRDPVYVINDLELMKQITIKDFDHFMNHRAFVNPETDPLFGNSLILLKDEKWKDMRNTLSPAFTGSKMRLMLQLITEICEEGVKYLKDLGKNEPKGFDIEMKEFYTRLTSDSVASTALGLKINSLTNKDNEFYNFGKSITTFSKMDFIKLVFYDTFKFIFKFFNIKIYDRTQSDYFYRLVFDAMKYRTENNIIRPDMINMLMEAQKSPEKTYNREWTNEEIVAQFFIFLFAGFESVSTTLCFGTQELIENQDVQKKLIAEIDEVRKELDGKPLTYEAMKNMKYMNMVVSEILRKWPPFIQYNRVCTKDYTLKIDDNLSIDLKPDDNIWLPVIGFQYDSDYFPNPKKFDPERFSDENKEKIWPFSYGPFGQGPRVCIGSRLALMEIKAILFYVLSNFTLEPNDKTTIPIKLAETNFPVAAKNGFWLRMIPRN